MGSGSVSAVVVMSASMRERAVFIDLISVWDTIGTLPPLGVEIVTLFPPAVRRVMGRKAPRKRLVCRVTSAFTRVFDARWHAPRVLRTHPNVSRRSAHPSIRVGEAKVANPGRKNAPREREWLFEK
jgi:hypothetical protein